MYKVRFRNLATKQKVDKSFKGDDALQEAFYETKEVQYLYANAGIYTFLDLESYDQFDLSKDDVENILPYIIEDMEGITALIANEQVLTLHVPDTIELEIVDCSPSMKGASATARTKPATLTTGLIVQVPEYIANGEVIKIDTRENKFLSRA